jgi:phage I-like protein
VFERAAFSIELTLAADAKAPPTEFRLFKAGKNPTLKGDVTYSARSQKACAEFAATLGRALVIDYEHASLTAAESRSPKDAGEAAGFFTVDARADGLYATQVEWVGDGAEKLTSKKFRYFSPVVLLDPKTREALGVVNAALTNNPATNGQQYLVASATTDTEPRPMKLLAAILKLSADATEDTVAAAVEKVRDERELLLTATGKASVAEASGVIASWKAGSEKAEKLSAQLVELEAGNKRTLVASLIKDGTDAGKVAPAQVELLTKMGLRDVEELKAFIAAAPKVLPTTAREPGAASTTVLVSDAEKAVAAQLGIKLDDLVKTKALVGPIVPTSEMKPANA